MLTIWGDNTGRFCDGISRRDFLRIGALGGALEPGRPVPPASGGVAAAGVAAEQVGDHGVPARRSLPARYLRHEARCTGRVSRRVQADQDESQRHRHLRAVPSASGPDGQDDHHPLSVRDRSEWPQRCGSYDGPQRGRESAGAAPVHGVGDFQGARHVGQRRAPLCHHAKDVLPHRDAVCPSGNSTCKRASWVAPICPSRCRGTWTTSGKVPPWRICSFRRVSIAAGWGTGNSCWPASMRCAATWTPRGSRTASMPSRAGLSRS